MAKPSERDLRPRGPGSASVAGMKAMSATVNPLPGAWPWPRPRPRWWRWGSTARPPALWSRCSARRPILRTSLCSAIPTAAKCGTAPPGAGWKASASPTLARLPGSGGMQARRSLAAAAAQDQTIFAPSAPAWAHTAVADPGPLCRTGPPGSRPERLPSAGNRRVLAPQGPRLHDLVRGSRSLPE